MIILAFSGGGTRATAFSYGVLEELRRTELTIAGQKSRMLDEVDVIAGVSGGSFTALANGRSPHSGWTPPFVRQQEPIERPLFVNWEFRFGSRPCENAVLIRFPGSSDPSAH